MIRRLRKRREQKRMLRSLLEFHGKVVDRSGTLYARSELDQRTGTLLVDLECVEPTCQCTHHDGGRSMTFNRFWHRHKHLEWKAVDDYDPC